MSRLVTSLMSRVGRGVFIRYRDPKLGIQIFESDGRFSPYEIEPYEGAWNTSQQSRGGRLPYSGETYTGRSAETFRSRASSSYPSAVRTVNTTTATDYGFYTGAHKWVQQQAASQIIGL